LSMLSAKKAAGTMACFCGILTGFTTSYSQRESIRDFGAVRPPPSSSSIHVPTQHSHNSLDYPYQPRSSGPHDALFSHKSDHRRAIPVQHHDCAAREGLASLVNRCKIA
jgi:hypothetical protein